MKYAVFPPSSASSGLALYRAQNRVAIAGEALPAAAKRAAAAAARALRALA